MPLITQRIARGLTPFFDPYLTPATRSRPEKIILGVKPGHRPSEKPPVRIFLGSERKQFRAERTFIFSVDKHRDPSRIYEIHLLKGLKGYLSGFWITGFTNYRFAIPYFCDYAGRAIYNDVDQVWLTDPAELFDRDMDGAGFLSINDHDTSVMLIDCRRMAGVWRRENVTGTTRKRIEARARAAGLWGPMEGRYNARDAEYIAGESACVHFTTLHTQPWRPFPDWFVYHDNPTGRLWHDLEQQADAAGFLPVSALRPSWAWPDTALALSARPDGPELVELLGARRPEGAHRDRRRITGLLERVPDADLPWVLERLFSTTNRLEVELNEPVWIRPGRPRRPLHFWIEQFRLAGRLHPDTAWRLERRVGGVRRVLRGGPLGDGVVRLDVAGAAPEAREAEALARALARRTGRALVGRDDATCAATAIRVAAAQRARAARREQRSADDPPALVLVGRGCGRVPEHGAAVVARVHHNLPPHPARLTTLLGLAPSTPVAEDAAGLPEAWQRASRRAALLIGPRPVGAWRVAELEQLLDAAQQWMARRDGRLLIVAHPQAPEAAAWLASADCPGAGIDAAARTTGHGSAARWPLALEHAHATLVAGGDEAMLAAAIRAPAPTWLVPWLPARRLGRRMAGRIAARAFRPDYNKRGSIRPQQGLTYLCARLIERGLVLPPDGLEALQRTLVERGLAAWIGSDALPSGRADEEFEPLVGTLVEWFGAGAGPDARLTADRPA